MPRTGRYHRPLRLRAASIFVKPGSSRPAKRCEREVGPSVFSCISAAISAPAGYHFEVVVGPENLAGNAERRDRRAKLRHEKFLNAALSHHLRSTRARPKLIALKRG